MQVLIQESDERFIGVGVVWQNYGNHMMPGKNKGTVGYLVGEGKIFGPNQPVDPNVGKEYDGGYLSSFLSIILGSSNSGLKQSVHKTVYRPV